MTTIRVPPSRTHIFHGSPMHTPYGIYIQHFQFVGEWNQLSELRFLHVSKVKLNYFNSVVWTNKVKKTNGLLVLSSVTPSDLLPLNVTYVIRSISTTALWKKGIVLNSSEPNIQQNNVNKHEEVPCIHTRHIACNISVVWEIYKHFL